MNRDDFLSFAQLADECLEKNTYIESAAAWTLIKGLSQHAAERGQRRGPKPAPAIPDAAILKPYRDL